MDDLSEINKKEVSIDIENDDKCFISKSSMDDDELIFKILIVGNQGYGKTSIIQTLCSGNFTNEYKATIGVDFAVKDIKIGNKNIIFQLWDIGGQERNHQLVRSYYKKAIGAFIVVDASDLKSLNNIQPWKESIDSSIRIGNEELIPTILLINKVDIQDKNLQNEEKNIMNLCSELQINEYIYTSAKENKNLDLALLRIGIQILKHPSLRSSDSLFTLSSEILDTLNTTNIMNNKNLELEKKKIKESCC